MSERMTVALDETAKALVIIDQTLLPNEERILSLTTAEDIWQAIHTLQVRGAPAIGVAVAIGLYVVSWRFEETEDIFWEKLRQTKDYLATARPTAVNLFWALNRMIQAAEREKNKGSEKIKLALQQEANTIWQEDIEVCHKLGEYGLTLIKDGDGILTHCNAGSLATVKYGTALAPIHLGRERGMNFKVYVDETRPLLQGARLSAYELQADGVDTTLICDNMASVVMKNGWIQAIFVGCDRVAANGDIANKIGTNTVAILAQYYHIPFYVCAPTSTIDWQCADGEAIVIEQRSPEEVSKMWYQKPMAPNGVNIFNPAFDVTKHELITAIITEYGIAYPPFSETLRQIVLKEGKQK